MENKIITSFKLFCESVKEKQNNKLKEGTLEHIASLVKGGYDEFKYPNFEFKFGVFGDKNVKKLDTDVLDEISKDIIAKKTGGKFKIGDKQGWWSIKFNNVNESITSGDHNSVEHFRYIDIETYENGLKIVLNDEGKEFLEDFKDNLNESIMFDLFEDVQGNSDYKFTPDLSIEGIGLTNAPAILDGYDFDKGGNYVDKFESGDEDESFDHSSDSKIYWYPNYQVKSFIDELYEEGATFFELAD